MTQPKKKLQLNPKAQEFNLNPPNPARFDKFIELENEDRVAYGFYIKAENYLVFYYDQYNGWYDEFGNYYNTNAEPSTPPKDSNKILPKQQDFLPELQNLNIQQNEYNDDIVDKYDMPNDYDDDQSDNDELDYQNQDLDDGDENYEVNSEDIENEILEMEEIIDEYPENEQITVYFDNMDSYVTYENVKNFFSQNKKIYFQKIEFYDRNQNEHSGSGHVIVNKQDALAIVRRHEQPMVFDGFKNYVKVSVDPFEEKDENGEQLNIKYVPKGQTTQSKEQDQTKTEQQQQSKQSDHELLPIPDSQVVQDLYNELDGSKKLQLQVSHESLDLTKSFVENIIRNSGINVDATNAYSITQLMDNFVIEAKKKSYYQDIHLHLLRVKDIKVEMKYVQK